MRNIIQDQLSHTFIEGPLPSKADYNNSQHYSGDKGSNTKPLQENTFQGNSDDNDISYYDVNERYD